MAKESMQQSLGVSKYHLVLAYAVVQCMYGFILPVILTCSTCRIKIHTRCQLCKGHILH